MIKILIKEIIQIKKADKVLFYAAPFFVIVASVLAFSAIPFGMNLQAIDFNIGVIYLLSVSSLGIIGILLAGWSSNNKYSMIGAMRSGAQFISYELSAGFSLMTIVVLSGTMQFSEIIEGQRYCWNLFNGHLPAVVAFALYLIQDMPKPTGGPSTFRKPNLNLRQDTTPNIPDYNSAFSICRNILTCLSWPQWQPHCSSGDGCLCR